MPVTVVLVEPQFPGNVGSVARAMANFDLARLILVRPCDITEEARNMAVHAQRILDEATVVESFQEVVDRMDWLVAFAARVSDADRSHLRVPLALRDASRLVHEQTGEIALVFGREDFGLSNEDVERCDVVATIPTSEAYRSLNLSHAAAIAFYELFAARFPVMRPREAAGRERDLLLAHVAAALDAGRMQPHRRELTLTMFRRVIGRAGLSKWEYHRMMGIFSPLLKRTGHWPVKGVPAELAPEEDDEQGPGSGDPDEPQPSIGDY